MFDRILIPLDGSPTAEGILAQVGRLLKRRDAEVLLLRAVGTPAVGNLEYASVLTALREEADIYVAGVRDRLAEQGVRVRGLVRHGPPADVIVDAAAEEKASLIAMSTHGRTGLARFVFGSVTEKVLRSGIGVPMLVMRAFRLAGEGGAPVGAREQPIRRILVPVHRSALSLWILPYVKELARLFGARITLLHVVEDLAVPASEGDPREVLDAAAKRLQSEGFEADALLGEGDPAAGIIDACARNSIDLVAMTTHGRSGIQRWVLGSVTEKVLRGAPVPVFVGRGGPPGGTP